MSPHVEVVSLYGSSNAGDRARALTFLERLGVPYGYTSYFPGNAAGIPQFVRSPTRMVSSERELRRLISAAPSCLLLRREASPLSKGSTEARLLGAAERGVYDLDDALHHDVRSPLFEAFFSKQQKARQAVGAADRVIVGNDYLADWASTYARDVRVIPTCVDPTSYRMKDDYRASRPPKMVWVGTRSGEGYIENISEPLLRFHMETGATLTIIGDSSGPLGDIEPMVERVRWSLGTVFDSLHEYDFGIMPLDNTSYERGKCAYKLLEYGAACLPAIATPLGVNAGILQSAGCPTPETPGEWYDALHQMSNASPDSRRSLGSRLHREVTDRFGFDVWVDAWADAMGIG